MNKKGNLLPEETLKIIIGVIVIGFLAYLLISIYFSQKNAQDLQRAEALIEEISEKASFIQRDSSIMNYTIPRVNPAGWYFFSFFEEEKPNQCFGKNCLCVCKEALIDELSFIVQNGQIKKCDELGACFQNENLKEIESFEIKGGPNPTSLFIYEEGGKIGVREL